MKPRPKDPPRGHANHSWDRVANSPGFVYFIQPASGGLIKIGWARDPETRRNELQTGSPVPLRIIGTIEGDQKLEREIHGRFAHLREHGEWFRPQQEIKAFMDEQLAARRMDREPEAITPVGVLLERPSSCEVCGSPRVNAVRSPAPGSRCEACEEMRVLREHGIDAANPTPEQEARIPEILRAARRST